MFGGSWVYVKPIVQHSARKISAGRSLSVTAFVPLTLKGEQSESISRTASAKSSRKKARHATERWKKRGSPFSGEPLVTAKYFKFEVLPYASSITETDRN